MVWTLFLFGVSMFILWKVAFPRIAEALDRRQKAIEESIDTAERTRKEADELLAEYRERLTAARQQADDIVARARKAGEQQEADAVAAGKRRREELLEQARKDIETETRRAIQEIRAEVADLTILATEKVTRKTLTGDDQRRLVDEAVAELDFADAVAGRGALARWRRSPSSTPARCSRPRSTRTSSTRSASSSASSPTRSTAATSCRCSSSRPTSRRTRRRTGCTARSTGRSELFLNFLELLLENHRMPAIFRIRRGYDRLWEEHNRLLPVEVTSAVELDEQTVRGIGDRIAEQTGRKVELSATVEPDILGGIVVRVGNQVLDASIRTRLDSLRKQVVRA